MSIKKDKFIALTGGVGGAKLCLGLAQLLSPEELVFLVNTGDDFEHLGFHIAPDLDTLMYTLSGLSNPELGWGRFDETWHFIEALKAVGGESWFNLGDADLATHVRRTELLGGGESLSAVTEQLNQALGTNYVILPMSNDPVQTQVNTESGALSFQHYFVRDRCEPVVTGFDFVGHERAAVNPGLDKWLGDPALAGIIICPSNPFVSIDPILSIPDMKASLRAANVPIIAISPIVGGEAIKGPTAKMMRELSVPASAQTVAAHYRGLIDGIVIDERDADEAPVIERLGIETTVAQSVMVTLADRESLARVAIDFATRVTLARPG